MQSENENMGELFMEAPREMELPSEWLLLLMRPLYGLCDSGDRWHHTLRHHVGDLQIEPLEADPALYSLSIGIRLLGLSGVYVDDMLKCGTPEFFAKYN